MKSLEFEGLRAIATESGLIGVRLAQSFHPLAVKSTLLTMIAGLSQPTTGDRDQQAAYLCRFSLSADARNSISPAYHKQQQWSSTFPMSAPWKTALDIAAIA